MRAGHTISTSRREVWTLGVSIAVHAVVLVWAALTFAAKPPTADPTPMPIDIISVSEFTELTAGSRNAPKPVAAPPVADMLGERKPPDDPAAKIAKTDIHAAIDTPAPEPKPPTPEKKQTQPQRDLIAEAIAKDAAKSEPKKSEQKSEQKKPDPKPEKKVEAKAEAKTPPRKEQPKFDPRKIEQALDKRVPQRVAATGDVVNSNVGIGAPNASSNQLSLSEIDAFRRHLGKCWSPPPGATSDRRVVVPITIWLTTDRMLDPEKKLNPKVEMKASDPYSQAMIESAVRAIMKCQPYTMFSLPKYETWRELSIDFDPYEMFGG
jgi:colicin import membrane protein